MLREMAGAVDRGRALLCAAHTHQQMKSISKLLGIDADGDINLAAFKGIGIASEDDNLSSAASCDGLHHKRGAKNKNPPVKLEGFRGCGFVCFIVDEAD